MDQKQTHLSGAVVEEEGAKLIGLKRVSGSDDRALNVASILDMVHVSETLQGRIK